MTIPRILVAGTHSGCGKTTIATGLMAALVARGLRVQPFKVGPDFIDPTHHTAICGRPSRNLDPFMMGERGVLETFGRATKDADVAIIEGVMGLYDGLEGTEIASSAHVAKLLAAPVVLAVDAGAMTRSASALVKGFTEFDPDVEFAGVVFNRIGGDNHRKMIEPSLKVRHLGWMPHRQEIKVNSRHLGLNMAHEGTISQAGKIVEQYCDVDAIVDSARAARQLPGIAGAECAAAKRVSIGIALDEAFCFYYQDNLDLLSAAGAELTFFSPIHDRLPDVDAVYLGGGYPELHLKELEASQCRHDLKKAASDGMPVYGECGGLMYLSETITTDSEYRMCGVLPARSMMTTKLQALGYVEASARDGRLFDSGLQYRGHEFHFSIVECAGDARFALDLTRGRGIDGSGHDGVAEHNALGAYTHAYFTREMARALARSAMMYQKK